MKYKSLLPLVAIALLMNGCGEEKKNLPAQKQAVITVDVVPLQSSEVARSLSIPGTIIPNEQVAIFSEVSGRIQKIGFQEGQNITQGALLVQVDTDILKAQKSQLQVQLALAQKDEARKKALLESKGISLQEYEIAESTLADVQAKMELLQVQISKASIRAPFTGKVGLRQVSEGAYITNTTQITTLVQVNPVKIEFAVPEKYARNVKTGQLITFHVEGDKKSYTGKVYAFEPQINEGTRMLTVRAQLPNPGSLIAGSYVSIQYDMGTELNAFMVPTESVIPILNGQKVYVERNGVVEEVLVDIGIRTPEKVQVFGDLKAGDHILISGLLAVRPGMTVKTKSVSK